MKIRSEVFTWSC